MLIDKSKSEYLNILDHINKLIPDTDPKILEGQILFSAPRVIPGEDLTLIPNSHPNDTYINNTEITVSPSPQFSWELPTTVQYRRIDLSKQWYIWTGEQKGTPTSPINYLIPKEKTTSREEEKQEVLRYVLSKLPFLKEESLVVTGGFTNDPTAEVTSNNFTIVPIDNSLLYIGNLTITGSREAKDDAVVPTPDKIPLPDVFNDHDMDSDGTKSNEGDGYDYDEEISD